MKIGILTDGVVTTPKGTRRTNQDATGTDNLPVLNQEAQSSTASTQSASTALDYSRLSLRSVWRSRRTGAAKVDVLVSSGMDGIETPAVLRKQAIGQDGTRGVQPARLRFLRPAGCVVANGATARRGYALWPYQRKTPRFMGGIAGVPSGSPSCTRWRAALSFALANVNEYVVSTWPAHPAAKE